MKTDVLTPQDIFFKVIRYEIPLFQRPYIWTENQQWVPLWEDVTALAESIVEKGRAEPHFLGAIVLQQIFNPMTSIETRVVVDGQQRLTTIQLLLDAIQEFCREAGFTGPAARLEGLVLNPKAFIGSEPDFAFKLWPTAHDQDAFRHAMHDDLDSAEFGSNRIVMAHNFFKGRVRGWLEQQPQVDNPEAAVTALERAVRDCLQVAIINLDQNDKPHDIFETLNARGTPLLPSDMVKNQILYEAGVGVDYEYEQSSQDVVGLWSFGEDYWRQEVGRGYQRRPRVDLFLNDWLAMRNGGQVRAQDEFRAFGRYVRRLRERQTIQQIASDMNELGALYKNIVECRIPEFHAFMRRRDVMYIGAVVPALLWLLSSDVPEEQLRKSISALDSYMMRRMILGWSARSYGDLFVRLTAELEKNGSQVAGDSVVAYLARQTAMASKWPNDSELFDAFLRNPLRQWLTAGRTRILLEGIEVGLRSPLTEPEPLSSSLQIEHVMPVAWGEHWPLQAAEGFYQEALGRRNRIIHTIGNLTLTTSRLNQRMSNSPWKTKRAALKDHSVLFMNKELLDHATEKWDEAAIEARSRRLHDVAVRVWPSAEALGPDADNG